MGRQEFIRHYMIRCGKLILKIKKIQWYFLWFHTAALSGPAVAEVCPPVFRAFCKSPISCTCHHSGALFSPRLTGKSRNPVIGIFCVPKSGMLCQIWSPAFAGVTTFASDSLKSVFCRLAGQNWSMKNFSRIVQLIALTNFPGRSSIFIVCSQVAT